MKIDYANEYNKNVKLNLDTNGAKFLYGFAVIEKKLTETELIKVKLLRNAPKTVMGVIDENEKVIVPFKDYYSHIDIFAKNNFIITIKSNEHMMEKIKVIHFHYNGSELIQVYEFSGKYYNSIDEQRIIMKESKNGENYNAIYDVNLGKFISNKFDGIEKFNEINGKEVALAYKRLNPNNDNSNVYCYIDKNGNIVSPIYNTFTNKYTDINEFNKKHENEFEFDFDIYIEKAKEELVNKRKEDEEIIKNVLIKKIGV